MPSTSSSSSRAQDFVETFVVALLPHLLSENENSSEERIRGLLKQNLLDGVSAFPSSLHDLSSSIQEGIEEHVDRMYSKFLQAKREKVAVRKKNLYGTPQVTGNNATPSSRFLATGTNTSLFSPSPTGSPRGRPNQNFHEPSQEDLSAAAGMIQRRWRQHKEEEESKRPFLSLPKSVEEELLGAHPSVKKFTSLISHGDDSQLDFLPDGIRQAVEQRLEGCPRSTSQSWVSINLLVLGTPDTVGERHYFANTVFPVLREQCYRCRVYLNLVDGCDFERNYRNLNSTLQNVRDCRIGKSGSSRGKTLSINFVGCKVGSVYPTSSNVLRLASEGGPLDDTFNWDRDLFKVISPEMLCLYESCLRRPDEAEAIVFLRDPYCFDAQIVDPEVADAVEEQQENLRVASTKLRERLVNTCHENACIVKEGYTCTMESATVDNGLRIVLGNLDELGRDSFTAVWKTVTSYHPPLEDRPLDQSTKRLLHRRMGEERVGTFVGMQACLNELKKYVKSNSDEPPCVLQGSEGSGKTAIVSKLMAATGNTRTRQATISYITYFVGAYSGSELIIEFLSYIAQEIASILGCENEVEKLLMQGPITQEIFVQRVLSRWSDDNGRLILIVDGVDQLKAIDEDFIANTDAGSSELARRLQTSTAIVRSPDDVDVVGWIPARPQQNLRFILSTTGKLKRQESWKTLKVHPLSEEEQFQLVSNQTAGSAVTENDIHDLLKRGGPKSWPLYLVTASRRLRAQSKPEDVQKTIANLPAEVDQIHGQLLGQLSSQFGAQEVKHSICFLSCCPYGLMEGELHQLVQQRLGRSPSRWEPLCQAIVTHFAAPNSSLERLVIPTSWGTSLVRALGVRDSGDGSNTVVSYRTQVAQAFTTFCDPDGHELFATQYPHGYSTILFQYREAGQVHKLVDLLSNFYFVSMALKESTSMLLTALCSVEQSLFYSRANSDLTDIDLDVLCGKVQEIRHFLWTVQFKEDPSNILKMALKDEDESPRHFVSNAAHDALAMYGRRVATVRRLFVENREKCNSVVCKTLEKSVDPSQLLILEPYYAKYSNYEELKAALTTRVDELAQHHGGHHPSLENAIKKWDSGVDPADGQYCGQWHEHYKQGHGVYMWNSPEMLYDGEWDRDEQCGWGRLEWKVRDDENDLKTGIRIKDWGVSGGEFQGNWKGDRLHGYGVYSWDDGSRYEGEWHNDNRHGEGVMVWGNGSVYKGSWSDNCMDGYGEKTEKDGVTTYRGSFKKGKREGFGCLEWPGGSFKGWWKAGLMTDFGIMTWRDEAGPSCVYIGKWENGRKHGTGLMRWKNGQYLSGSWREDQKQSSTIRTFHKQPSATDTVSAK